MIYLNIWLLSVIIVFIIDLSGIVESIDNMLSRWMGYKCRLPKPFSCSLCMTFWSGLIYIIINNKFSIPMVAYVSMVSLLTTVTESVLILLKELMIKLLEYVQRVIQ